MTQTGICVFPTQRPPDLETQDYPVLFLFFLYGKKLWVMIHCRSCSILITKSVISETVIMILAVEYE